MDNSSRSSTSRRRSRSRSRSRDRDRDRDRSRDGDRDKKKSRKWDRHDHHKTSSSSSTAIISKKQGIDDIMGGEEEERKEKLEQLMMERRAKVEKWRMEQAIKKGLIVAGQEKNATQPEQPEPPVANDASAVDESAAPTSRFFLDDEFAEEEEDEEEEVAPQTEADQEEKELMLPTFKKKDDDDDEIDDKFGAKNKLGLKKNILFGTKTVKKEPIPAPETKMDVDDDTDPLDAFMVGIQNEVKKLKGIKSVKEEKVKEGGKTQILVAVAKKKPVTEEANKKIKGDLMEQNQDLLEYSSEEETTTTAADLQSMNQSLAQKKDKKMVAVSLDDISYKPFTKNFYIEVPELTSMTSEEVEKLRENSEGIKVRGKNVPKPILNWAQAGVSRKIMDLLKKLNYKNPTPIQAQAIPTIMSGRDMIGIAKTGSGKTLAFLLPLLRHVCDQPPLEPGEGPIAVIMTPTRELATQIWSECRKFAKNLNLRVVAVYGGTAISEQIGELKPGAEIVVCTPGRMIDMVAANNGKVTNLKRCTYIVLDEADRMFDMGFEPQVMRIIDGIRPDRQTVMFSATFPRIMESLARRILDKPVEIIVGGRSVVAKEITQHAFVLNEEEKFLKLLEVLGANLTEDKTAIVFVEKQESADGLLKELLLARYSCLALHGGIDQIDRDSIISDYKHARVKVLVATSVAARGLDVKHCYVVINYDPPNHYEDYVHRCGRTGRAGQKGLAYTFLTEDQGKFAGDIIKAFEASEVLPPKDVKDVFANYKACQEALGKKVSYGGGFSGKGFKFDEAEAQLMNDKKKMQKAAFGLNDSDDEDEDGKDLDAEIESMLAPKSKVVKSSVQETIPSTAAPSTTATPVITGDSISDKMEAARRLAAKLSATHGHTPAPPQPVVPQIPDSVLGVGIGSTALRAKSVAEQIAEKLHAKLGYIPKEDVVEPGSKEGDANATGGHRDDNFKRYEEELEINDFPQQARWRVTSREALAQISEYSEAGLTVRGTFYPPGAKVPESDRKLYLAIEGTNELAVSKARTEIIRLIKDELQKAHNSSYQPANKGRYKVL